MVESLNSYTVEHDEIRMAVTTRATGEELSAIISWMMEHTGTVSITWRPIYPVEADTVYTVTWRSEAERFAYWMHTGQDV